LTMYAQVTAPETVLKLYKRLALRGDARSPTYAASSWTPYCDDPRTVVLFSKHTREYSLKDMKKVEVPSMEVQIKVPCRKCDSCLVVRQLQWADRAKNELGSQPDWFVTLTFNDAELNPIIAMALIGASADGRDDLRASDLDTAAYPLIQKWFKRLRFAGHQFRYLAVCELGEKTGRLHYHVILHDQRASLTAQLIEDSWPHGHSHKSSVRNGSATARYVAKYLTKDSGVRFRASFRYGKKT